MALPSITPTRSAARRRADMTKGRPADAGRPFEGSTTAVR